jgi:transcriptional regulator GlxA family with amidase domain
VRIDVYHHWARDGSGDEVLRLLRQLLRNSEAEMKQLDDLAKQVQKNTDAEDSAVTLLGSLAQLIRDNTADPAALTDLADKLDASKEKLAAAVVANTPAAPGG